MFYHSIIIYTVHLGLLKGFICIENKVKYEKNPIIVGLRQLNNSLLHKTPFTTDTYQYLSAVLTFKHFLKQVKYSKVGMLE